MKKDKHVAFMRLYAAVTGKTYQDRSVGDILDACLLAEKHADVYRAAMIKRDAEDEIRATLERGEW